MATETVPARPLDVSGANQALWDVRAFLAAIDALAEKLEQDDTQDALQRLVRVADEKALAALASIAEASEEESHG